MIIHLIDGTYELFRHRVKGFASRGFLLPRPAVIVHLIDGTYELFRHFYGLRWFNKGKGRPYGAVVGVLQRYPATRADQSAND